MRLLAQPRDDQREHLALARRQALGGGAAPAARAIASTQARGDRRVEQRLAGVRGADRAGELGAAATFLSR